MNALGETILTIVVLGFIYLIGTVIYIKIRRRMTDKDKFKSLFKED